MTQTPPPDEFTTIHRLPPRQYSKSQVGDEQQLAWPTATVWRTIEGGHQSAFHQMTDAAVDHRTIAGPCKGRNVCHRRKWKLCH
jgi:hypothetical protein